MVLMFRGSHFDGGGGTGLNQRKEERKNRERKKPDKERKRKKWEKKERGNAINTYGPHRGQKFKILPLSYVS